MRVRISFVLLAGLIVFFWFPAFARAQVPEVDASTLGKWVSEIKDLVLIDVGTPGDFSEGHIPGSISLPLRTSFKEGIKSLAKEKTYILICPTGHRSATAAKLMMEQGFKKVYNLKGGVTDWLRKGFKVANRDT
jgi:rhodanese-related sulfurtransferase